METRSAKRKKVQLLINQIFESDTFEDRISDLPDDIVHRILLLLPIKSIAQTSVLSKRWRNLWSSFPDLDFNTIESNSVNSVSDCVADVLALRRRNSELRTLRFYGPVTLSRLNSLIRRAVSLKVQELDVDVSTTDSFNIPRSVMASDSLRVFRLQSRRPGFRLPPVIMMKAGFQSLHNLTLSSVILHEQPSLVDLFTDSSFPVLRNLNLDSLFGLQNLTITCRALNDLTLKNTPKLEDLEICGSKLETLRVTGCFNEDNETSRAEIKAPALRTIIWANNYVTENLCVENFDCLNEATVGFNGFQRHLSDRKIANASRFLSVISNVQSLIIENEFVEILSKTKSNNLVPLDPFNNLNTLGLRLSDFYKDNFRVIALLSRSCPMVTTLDIKIGKEKQKSPRRLHPQWNNSLWESSNRWEEEFWESQRQVLRPFFSNIKVVKIHGFMECEDDIGLLKLLLKHGEQLKEIHLCLGHFGARDSLRRDRIHSQVMAFCRNPSKVVVRPSF